MDINFELYKVFYQVASTLSFSEASKKLYISQSAANLSRRWSGNWNSRCLSAVRRKYGLRPQERHCSNMWSLP